MLKLSKIKKDKDFTVSRKCVWFELCSSTYIFWYEVRHRQYDLEKGREKTLLRYGIGDGSLESPEQWEEPIPPSLNSWGLVIVYHPFVCVSFSSLGTLQKSLEKLVSLRSIKESRGRGTSPTRRSDQVKAAIIIIADSLRAASWKSKDGKVATLRLEESDRREREHIKLHKNTPTSHTARGNDTRYQIRSSWHRIV